MTQSPPLGKILVGAPLIDEECSLLVHVLIPILLLKIERQEEEKAKDTASQKEKLQKESGGSNPFSKCLQVHVPPRLQNPISLQVPRDRLIIEEVSNSFLTTTPELSFLLFSSTLPSFSFLKKKKNDCKSGQCSIHFWDERLSKKEKIIKSNISKAFP